MSSNLENSLEAFSLATKASLLMTRYFLSSSVALTMARSSSSSRLLYVRLSRSRCARIWPYVRWMVTASLHLSSALLRRFSRRRRRTAVSDSPASVRTASSASFTIWLYLVCISSRLFCFVVLACRSAFSRFMWSLCCRSTTSIAVLYCGGIWNLW